MAVARSGEIKRLLVVGLACLDIINTVEHYPQEDEDMRALSQRWQKGGNAANASEVLSQTLDTCCELLCSLNEGIEGQYVSEELRNRGVLIENCPVKKNCGFPTSCVLVNEVTGSRTIVHSRNNLPELEFKDFDIIDLSLYSWIHFEGRRNVDEIIKMIRKVENLKKEENLRIKISVEIEKKRPELRALFDQADVVFIGKDFAQFSGFSTPEEAVMGLSTQVPTNSVLVCPWGESGAVARGCAGEICTSPAYPPTKVVDTLGAGDTFLAGVIFCLNQGRMINDAIQFGCKLAGRKCGMQGFDELKVTPNDDQF
ncbi:ketohexokinase-like [Dendronephthya gigantea]|uniref:ketohexokinase-like n=1 Tax=Dendronephthya gigantea TaxID=151771 RepID=UPI001068EBE7|nr:ketohexokinase-like [Dendronephthya gigantea]